MKVQGDKPYFEFEIQITDHLTSFRYQYTLSNFTYQHILNNTILPFSSGHQHTWIHRGVRLVF